MIAAAIVIGVSAVSFTVHRSIVADAVETGRPIAEKRQKDISERERVHARTDTLKNVLSNLETALADRPYDSMLVISAANIAYDLQEFETAERYYRRYLENIDNSDASVLVDLSFVVFQQGESDDAIEILTNVVDADPSNQTAMFNLAYMYEQLQQPDEAMNWIERCRDANPDSPIGQQAAAILAQESTE